MGIIEQLTNAIVEKVIKSVLLLFCGLLMYFEGGLMLFLIYGHKKKRINRIFKIKVIGYFMPLIVGAACSTIVFIFQNYNTIIKSEMTIELVKSNILSSVLLSFAIVGVISIIVLPVQEIIKFRGGHRNNGN